MRSKTLIIAEAGVNHNGDINIAKKMIETAKECGADVIKFQTAVPEALTSVHAPMADYQKKNTGKTGSQIEMLRKLLLPFDDFRVLAEHCREVGIQFLSTPFDIESVHFLNDLQEIWKIPSGEITNYPYLVEIAGTGKKIILSTGMSTMQEVDDALDVLRENGAGDITVLHCTTSYPAPLQEVNLCVMQTLREHCDCPVGYSDHTNGIEVPIAAVAMGASIIEKHFTLDRSMEGPDHKASLEPEELAAMVQAIRKIELAIGDGRKLVTASERTNRSVARKSIIASRDIRMGEVLTVDNITTKRPGNGISPMRWKEVLGTAAVRDFHEDELIEI